MKGDPDLEFQYVAKAIDIAHGAGIDKVGLMTPQSGGRKVMKRKAVVVLAIAAMSVSPPVARS